jgi:hypothetical protein
MTRHRDGDDPDDDLAAQVKEAMRAFARTRGSPGDDDDEPVFNPTEPAARGLGKILAVPLIILGALAAALLAQQIRFRTATPDGPVQPVVSSAGASPSDHALFAQRRVEVHQEADPASSVVGTLEAGERVEIGRRKAGGWVQVAGEHSRAHGYALRSRQNLLPVRPTLPPPRDTTAICGDSTSWFGENASGTCSHRGGVLCWIDHPPPVPEHLSKPFCRSILPPWRDES